MAAYLRRDWATERSYRLPFFMHLFQSLFLAVLLVQVSRFVDTDTDTGSLSHGFFSYAIVGMAVLQVVQTSASSFAGRFQQEQTTGTLEALLSTPSRPSSVILGSGLFALLESLALAAVLLVISVPLGLHIELSAGSLVFAVVVLAGLIGAFSSIGICIAAFTIVFKRGNTLAQLVSSGVALVCGVFYPIDQLPSVLRWIAAALPITWGVEALRSSLVFGDVDLLRGLGTLAAAVVGLVVAIRVFRAGLDHARRAGTLSQY
jgi:ABC-2 type transport system permease protein